VKGGRGEAREQLPSASSLAVASVQCCCGASPRVPEDHRPIVEKSWQAHQEHARQRVLEGARHAPHGKLLVQPWAKAGCRHEEHQCDEGPEDGTAEE